MPNYVMNDAREFTDYNSPFATDEFLQKKYNLKNSHDYRRYLQQNATTIMNDMLKCASKNGDTPACPVCKKDPTKM